MFNKIKTFFDNFIYYTNYNNQKFWYKKIKTIMETHNFNIESLRKYLINDNEYLYNNFYFKYDTLCDTLRFFIYHEDINNCFLIGYIKKSNIVYENKYNNTFYYEDGVYNRNFYNLLIDIMYKYKTKNIINETKKLLIKIDSVCESFRKYYNDYKKYYEYGEYCWIYSAYGPIYYKIENGSLIEIVRVYGNSYIPWYNEKYVTEDFVEFLNKIYYIQQNKDRILKSIGYKI